MRCSDKNIENIDLAHVCCVFTTSLIQYKKMYTLKIISAIIIKVLQEYYIFLQLRKY